ncbi:MAG: PP2C family protein-serine/threonine phosphatase, partial [Succinivibrio sp.]
NEPEKSDDCFAMLKVSDKDTKNLINALKKSAIDYQRLWCTTVGNSALTGYTLTTSDGSDRHFIYVRKLSDNALYPAIDVRKALSLIPLKSYVTDSSYELLFLDGKLNVINSTSSAFRPSDIPSTSYEEAKSTLTPVNGQVSANDRDRLYSLVYIRDYDCYAAVVTLKSTVIKPIVYLNFLALLLCALLSSLFIFVSCRILDSISASHKKLANNVDVMAANILSDLSTMNKITSKCDPSAQTYLSLKKLNESINSLGRSICENVASKENELLNKGKEDAKKAADDAVSSLISSVHKALMPDGSDMPTSKFLEFASFIEPSAHNPSDFYDVFRVDRDNIGVVFGSCSKPGLEATNVINQCNSFIRKSLSRDKELPAKTLTELNHILMQKKFTDGFNLSLFVMILSEFTGNFIYAQAGLKAPVLIHLHKGKIIEPIQVQVELCTDIDTEYINSKGKITFLDSIVFAGNGITSLKNTSNDSFGIDRVIRLCEENSDKSAYDQLITMYKDLRSFGDGQENDLDVCSIIIKKNAINKEFDE